jgi:hyaluronan synthase
MDSNEPEIISGTIDQNFSAISIRVDWQDFIYKTAIITLGLITTFLIILLKSKTTTEFQIEPYLFSYAIFVTTFELSRIIAAMMYENSMESLLNEKAADNFQNYDYEPTVAFVIPCKNEERDIRDSVTKCFQIDYPKDKVEVIVVNDGSTDGTKDALLTLKNDYPKMKVIEWPNQGKRWAMAAGFEVSNSEIIIQLDSDSQVDPETFRELILPFRNSRVGAVCAHGVPKNADDNFITRMQTAYYFMSFRILKAAESTFNTVFCLSGCCSAYRKKSVMPVIYNWLSESFLGKPVTWGDDRALTSWLLKRGERTVYSKDAIAYTVVPDSWRKLFKQQLRWKKSWIINSLFTSSFIWKKQPFVSFFYYFPLVAISFLTPFMTFRALIYNPIMKGEWPFYHILGIILMTAIMVVYYRFVDKKNKYWPYLFPWALLTLFVWSFVIVWAAIRIQDRGWGTR